MSKITRQDWIAPDKKAHPSVLLTFDDGAEPKEAFFRFDYNRICEVEEMSGLNLGSAAENASAQQTRAIVCAYLRGSYDTTLEEAGDLMTRDRRGVLTAVQEAMIVAKLIPESEPETESVQAPPATPPSE